MLILFFVYSCEFTKASCSNGNLIMQSMSSCATTTTTGKPTTLDPTQQLFCDNKDFITCPSVVNHVCASNGVVYNNEWVQTLLWIFHTPLDDGSVEWNYNLSESSMVLLRALDTQNKLWNFMKFFGTSFIVRFKMCTWKKKSFVSFAILSKLDLHICSTICTMK